MKWRSLTFGFIFCSVFVLLTAVFQLVASFKVSANFTPNLIINEVDYDQGTIDGAEFVEITNIGTSESNLDLYNVRFVDGSGVIGVEYNTIDLPAVTLMPGEYYVICSNIDAVVNCDLDFAGFIQDGAPDAVALFSGDARVDSVSYEGNTPAPYTEGSALLLLDDGTGFTGISRFPNASDIDNNDVDFSTRCITPGLANIVDTTNCEQLLLPVLEVTVSPTPTAVPEPGGVVTLSIRIDNLSVLNITLTSLTDNDAQDLNGMGSCVLPQTLAGFESYECDYQVDVLGDFEDEIVRTVTAVGEDDFDIEASDTGQTIITISQRIHWELFLPSVARPLPNTYGEPNDTCADAHAINLNQNNFFKAEDAEDWYVFDLSSSLSLRVSLQNFVPQGGNLSVWRGSCGELDFVGSDGSTAVNRTLDLGQQPAGHYYVWLISDPPFNGTDLYNLQLLSP